MSLPKPKYPLENHCSIIHDNTLYVYSPAGFQSLRLQQGAQWEDLPMQISLQGAQCVQVAPTDNPDGAQLWLVGGETNATAKNWQYPGLITYTFSERKWDWVRPTAWNTKERHNHGAIYLPESQKILVYAGSSTPGDAVPSSQTFLFDLSSIPPQVTSFESMGAPPSYNPMLMAGPDGKSALLVGGGINNKAVWRFTDGNGWSNTNAVLQDSINQDIQQCETITAQDGSVIMQKFDMSVTPNTIQRIQLLDSSGNPVSKTTAKLRRAVVPDWAAPINNTNAPKTPRNRYKITQSDNGITVASGGDPDVPFVMFDAEKNAWVDPNKLFGPQKVIVQSASSTIGTSRSATRTSQPTASITAAAAAAMAPATSNKTKMLTVLGATLGTIFGMALFLILILICLKLRKNRIKNNQGYAEKNRLSFADRGADYMKEAGGSVMNYRSTPNDDSTTSLAITGARGAVGHKRNTASDASTAGLMKKPSPLGYSDPVELSKLDMNSEHERDKITRQNSGSQPPSQPRSRSSGWSRYFTNNEATNLANVKLDRSTYVSDRTSTDSRYVQQNAAPQLAPLNISKFDGQRLSHVTSGSPTLGTPRGILPHQVQPMQAELARANSNGSIRSIMSHDDHMYREPVDSWTPVGAEDRRTSSNYTDSRIIEPNTKYDMTNTYYPDGTDPYSEKSHFSPFYPMPGTTLGMSDVRGSTATAFPSSNATAAPVPTGAMSYNNQNMLSAMYLAPQRFPGDQDRVSTVTVFPGPGESAAPVSSRNDALPSPKLGSFYPPPRVGHESTVTVFPGPSGAEGGKPGQSDMSWLNLRNSR